MGFKLPIVNIDSPRAGFAAAAVREVLDRLCEWHPRTKEEGWYCGWAVESLSNVDAADRPPSTRQEEFAS